MPRRTTLSDIARRTRLSVATVSRALRGRIEISADTRERVRLAAEALKYTPDPALSALVEHRRGLRQARFLETVAIVSPSLTLAESRRLPRRMALIDAMRERAEELGYKLDFFHLPFDAARARELVRILHRRRIRGLVLLPSDPPAENLPLPWHSFAAVRVYRPPLDARLSSVDTDLYQGAHLILRHLEAHRLRRVGLVLPRVVVPYTRDTWPNYMAMIAAESGAIETVPPFVFQQRPDSEPDRSELLRWFGQYRPDVVVAMECLAVQAAFRGLPKSPALVDLDVDPVGRPSGAPPGLLQSRTAIGSTTINHLHGLLVSNTHGLPEYPTTVKTAFRWVDESRSVPSR